MICSLGLVPFDHTLQVVCEHDCVCMYMGMCMVCSALCVMRVYLAPMPRLPLVTPTRILS